MSSNPFRGKTTSEIVEAAKTGSVDPKAAHSFLADRAKNGRTLSSRKSSEKGAAVLWEYLNGPKAKPAKVAKGTAASIAAMPKEQLLKLLIEALAAK